MTHSRQIFRGKRVLLLQGPVGPFFRRFADLITGMGAQTFKVNFNGGDCLFYPAAISFRGSLDTWPAFLEPLLERLRIDIVVLFGDCRSIHRVAQEVAKRRGIEVRVFEEGYVRPNFITFELDGVNGRSRIPRSSEFFRALPSQAIPPERSVGGTFWHTALWAGLYYCAAAALSPRFRRYRHHRPLTLSELFPWLRSGWRKLAYGVTERRRIVELTGPLSKRFFLVPLQISRDSQVLRYSEFASVTNFVRHVAESFAAHAPADTTLVIKHHPLDRGYYDYRPLLRGLELELGLTGRLLYIHDQHLPTLFDHMCGAVVINSTVGFSALSHGAPVKTCGRAIYDLEGLTYQGSLNEFWHGAASFRPDAELLRRFRTFVIDDTQLNGSFYKGPIQFGRPASPAVQAGAAAAQPPENSRVSRDMSNV
jgi:capsular polysaccharide export protein